MGSEKRSEMVYYIVLDGGKVFPVTGIESVEFAMNEDRLLFDSEDEARAYWRKEYEMD